MLEDDAVVLQPGGTFVPRGTKHAWSNRGEVPAMMVFTQVAADGPLGESGLH